MDRKPIIAVIGPGETCPQPLKVIAEELGAAIGAAGYNIISGGKNIGVMDAVSKGAKENGSIVIGILPGMDSSDASPWLDIPIVTGAGSARNNFIVLSSDVIIALGRGAGTFSEIALTIKANKPLLLFQPEQNLYDLAVSMGNRVCKASSVEEAMAITEEILENNSS